MSARLLCAPLLLVTTLAFAQPAGTPAFPSTPPPDVDSVRRLHAPPRVVVEVQRVDAPPKGGDGPCKDPVCLALVLSVMAIEKVFPKQYDKVTVLVDGESRLQGTYEVGGRFLSGYTYSPEGTRRFDGLELRHLRKMLVVETGRGKPQLPVEELLADYRRALAATQYAETRAGLLSEALRILGEPALPLVRERLADPAEADEVKASVLASGCDAQGSGPLSEVQVRTLFDAALGTPTPGAETLAVTVSCRLERKQPVTRDLLGALVAGFCRTETLELEGRAYKVLSRLKNEDSSALDPTPLFDDSCEQPARRAVLRTCLGPGAAREEYAAAFAEKDAQDLPRETGKAVLQCLRKDRREHRVGFEEAFRAAPYQRLEWVEGRDTPLEAWELEALARGFFFYAPVKPYWKRAWVLDQFARVASDPERTAPARAVLREWVRKTEQERKVTLAKEGDVMRFLRGVQDKVVGPASNDLTVTARIALMVLGELDETPGAALGLPREPHPVAQTSVDKESALAAYAFTLVGCTRAEMQAASTLLHAKKPMPRGPWCASQKQGR